jgi:predicted dehydrogenase
MIRVAVIGYGYWGPKLVRNFSGLAEAGVAAVCDQRPELLAQVRRHYPAVAVTAEPEDLFRDPKIHAIAIATPVSSHFDLARRALRAGKHVWVEKPMAATTEEASLLVEEVARAQKTLVVDHTFIYTGAVRKIRELLAKNAIGELFYYDSVRSNLGLFQGDVNVLWDLAVHDVAIIDALFPQKPVAVSATGISHVPNQPENMAYLTLFFPGRQIAHVHVNWLSPVKLRRTLIGGSEKMILWDDADVSEKVKVYDKGIMVSDSEENLLQKRIGYRTGDMWAPQIERTEALSTLAQHFIDCIQSGQQPESDVHSGRRVVRILEAASKSMTERGRHIEL